MIKKRKRNFFKKYTNGNPNWWKEVNELRNISNKTSIDSQTCNKLNDYFHGKWVNKQANISVHTYREFNNCPTIEFSSNDVLEELSKLETGKAAGPDIINAKILKSAKYEILDIVTHLFNECIKYNVVPTQWKDANIAPVPKTAKPSKPEDYRPISLTSTLCKVMERLLAKFIIEQTKELWLENQQYGFLPGKNTSDALIQVIEDLSKAFDNNQSISAIFFDFTSAFDLVEHEILMPKLEKYLPRWLTTWIAKYLTNRRQRVKTPNHETDWKDVEAGVIQGSVLGPILFIIFLSDINEYIPKNIKAPKYADDILTIDIHDKNEKSNIQEAANGVSKWCELNRMIISEKKTKSLQTNKSGTTAITVNGEIIENVEKYKYLGVQINKDLNWDEHWHTISQRFNPTLYLIKTLKNLFLPTEILITVYKSLVLSQIISNATTLCSTTQAAKDEMESLQKRFLRAIGLQSEEEIKKYNIPPIASLIEKHCKATLNKILSDPNHPITKSLPTRDTTKTRNKFPIAIQKCNKQKYQESFLQQYLRVLEAESIKDATPAQIPPIPTNVESVKCDICGKSLKNQKGLNRHIRLMHQTLAQQPDYKNVTIRRGKEKKKKAAKDDKA